ncbi:MAG: GGDEF domain-containing protein, partial [Thermochromatium sp.]
MTRAKRPPRACAPPRPLPTIAQADWSAAIARIDVLPIGTLLWTKKRGGSTALRLIWRSPDGSHLGLSDPVGKRFIGLRRSRLAQKLLHQHIVIDRPMPEGGIQHAATAALERMESQIHEHDLPDPLTGLANQRRLRQALIEVLADWSPAGWPLVLGVLELDRFALMASHYGFEVSEQILKSAAELLCAQLTEACRLAYLGSGRFGVLTAIGDRDEILALGERLRVALHRLPLASKTQSSTHGFTWSLGFSLLDRRNNA